MWQKDGQAHSPPIERAQKVQRLSQLQTTVVPSYWAGQLALFLFISALLLLLIFFYFFFIYYIFIYICCFLCLLSSFSTAFPSVTQSFLCVSLSLSTSAFFLFLRLCTCSTSIRVNAFYGRKKNWHVFFERSRWGWRERVPIHDGDHFCFQLTKFIGVASCTFPALSSVPNGPMEAALHEQGDACLTTMGYWTRCWNPRVCSLFLPLCFFRFRNFVAFVVN